MRFRANNLILISLGALPGALLSWQLQDYVYANLLGSFVFGILLGLKIDGPIKLLLGFGFCGSLTTYSGWIINSLLLIYKFHWIAVIYSIFFLLSLGLAFAFLGFYLGKLINRLRHFQ